MAQRSAVWQPDSWAALVADEQSLEAKNNPAEVGKLLEERLLEAEKLNKALACLPDVRSVQENKPQAAKYAYRLKAIKQFARKNLSGALNYTDNLVAEMQPVIRSKVERLLNVLEQKTKERYFVIFIEQSRRALEEENHALACKYASEVYERLAKSSSLTNIGGDGHSSEARP